MLFTNLSAAHSRVTNGTKRVVITMLLGAALALVGQTSMAADAAKAPATQLSRESHAALKKLYAKVPIAKKLGPKARAILVFPSVTKAGLMIGGQYGEGALIKGGKTVGYYSTAGASYGLQIGVQQYGYAMFLMNNKALAALDTADGFEVGVGPSLVVVDEGTAYAKTTTTTTMKDDIYAFIFSQEGLMAGLGLQGNKITKIDAK